MKRHHVEPFVSISTGGFETGGFKTVEDIYVSFCRSRRQIKSPQFIQLGRNKHQRARLRSTRRRDGDRPRGDVGVLGPVHVWLAVRVDRIRSQRARLPRHRARVVPGFEEARSPIVAHGRASGGRARGTLAAARVRTMHPRVFLLRRGRGDEPRERRNALRRCVQSFVKPRRSSRRTRRALLPASEEIQQRRAFGNPSLSSPDPRGADVFLISPARARRVRAPQVSGSSRSSAPCWSS